MYTFHNQKVRSSSYREDKSSSFIGPVIGLDLYLEVAERCLVPLQHGDLAVSEAPHASHESVEIFDSFADHFEFQPVSYMSQETKLADELV